MPTIFVEGQGLVSVNTWTVVSMDVGPEVVFRYDDPAATIVQSAYRPGQHSAAKERRVCDMTVFDDIEVDGLRARGIEVEILPLPELGDR